MVYTAVPMPERFWRLTIPEPNSGCLLWLGSMFGKHGYGSYWFTKGKLWKSHRVAWVLTHGDIPDGLFVLHSCDVRLCVNPRHLRLGSIRDNSLDMARRNRGARGALPPGVFKNHDRYGAYVCATDGPRSRTNLGTFATLEEAAAVAAAAKKELYQCAP